jgi:hypothetical protein
MSAGSSRCAERFLRWRGGRSSSDRASARFSRRVPASSRPMWHRLPGRPMSWTPRRFHTETARSRISSSWTCSTTWRGRSASWTRQRECSLHRGGSSCSTPTAHRSRRSPTVDFTTSERSCPPARSKMMRRSRPRRSRRTRHARPWCFSVISTSSSGVGRSSSSSRDDDWRCSHIHSPAASRARSSCRTGSG